MASLEASWLFPGLVGPAKQVFLVIVPSRSSDGWCLKASAGFEIGPLSFAETWPPCGSLPTPKIGGIRFGRRESDRDAQAAPSAGASTGQGQRGTRSARWTAFRCGRSGASSHKPTGTHDRLRGRACASAGGKELRDGRQKATEVMIGSRRPSFPGAITNRSAKSVSKMSPEQAENHGDPSGGQ